MSLNLERSANNQESSQETQDSQTKAISDLQKKIASTERAIKLAESLNDSDRMQQMQTKKSDFESALKELELGDLDFTTPAEKPSNKPERNFDVADMDSFDVNTRNTGAREDRSARRNAQ